MISLFDRARLALDLGHHGGTEGSKAAERNVLARRLSHGGSRMGIGAMTLSLLRDPATKLTR
jgi:hypothetical protein